MKKKKKQLWESKKAMSSYKDVRRRMHDVNIMVTMMAGRAQHGIILIATL